MKKNKIEEPRIYLLIIKAIKKFRNQSSVASRVVTFNKKLLKSEQCQSNFCGHVENIYSILGHPIPKPNSVIEFQYRFRYSELVNSKIFWALKLTTFGQKLGVFNIFQRYIFSKLFYFQNSIIKSLKLVVFNRFRFIVNFCKNLAIGNVFRF